MYCKHAFISNLCESHFWTQGSHKELMTPCIFMHVPTLVYMLICVYIYIITHYYLIIDLLSSPIIETWPSRSHCIFFTKCTATTAFHTFCTFCAFICISDWIVIYLSLLQPQQVELVEGYGVYLSKRQLEEAVDQSCNSATRLIRNLLMVFFSPSVLASSSCLGTRKYPALNKDITGACFRESSHIFGCYVKACRVSRYFHVTCKQFYKSLGFVQSRHPTVMRSSLVDAVNDKCANYRTKTKWSTDWHV